MENFDDSMSCIINWKDFNAEMFEIGKCTAEILNGYPYKTQIYFANVHMQAKSICVWEWFKIMFFSNIFFDVECIINILPMAQLLL